MSARVFPPAKVVVLGDMNVGKTCLISRFVNDFFPDVPVNTIRDAHYPTPVNSLGTQVILDIWDTPGQEEYASCSTALLRDAICCVICYDAATQPRSATAPSSYDQVQVFADRYRDIGLDSGFVVVSANKCDRMDPQQQAEEADRMQAQQNGFWLRSFLTSAKTGEGVKELFGFVAQKVLERPVIRATTDRGRLQEQESQGGCC
jgi:small GTP-binding protein